MATLGCALLLVFAAGWRSPASAVVIITSYPPLNDASAIDIDDGVGVAVGFTLPVGASYSLSSVMVRISAEGAVTSFSAELFGDGGVGPVAPPLVTFPTPPIGIGPSVDYVLTPASSFILQPSTTYWLVLRGQVPTSASGLSWRMSIFAGTTGIASGAGYRQDSGDPPTTPIINIVATTPIFQVNADPAVVVVPTLGQWGWLTLVALMALVALLTLGRRTA